MKLIALLVLKWKGLAPEQKEPLILASAFDVSSFGFFQRSGIREFANFMARTVTQRTQPGSRMQIEKEEHVCYVHVKTTGIAAVLVTDAEYPARVSFSLLSKVLIEFDDRFKGRWNDPSYNKDQCMSPFNAQLEETLRKYQNPEEADSIMKIQKDLDDTKTIMHQAIESVLERGEKLDDLFDKSQDISVASKAFYTTARGQNSCCSVQ